MPATHRGRALTGSCRGSCSEILRSKVWVGFCEQSRVSCTVLSPRRRRPFARRPTRITPFRTRALGEPLLWRQARKRVRPTGERVWRRECCRGPPLPQPRAPCWASVSASPSGKRAHAPWNKPGKLRTLSKGGHCYCLLFSAFSKRPPMAIPVAPGLQPDGATHTAPGSVLLECLWGHRAPTSAPWLGGPARCSAGSLPSLLRPRGIRTWSPSAPLKLRPALRRVNLTTASVPTHHLPVLPPLQVGDTPVLPGRLAAAILSHTASPGPRVPAPRGRFPRWAPPGPLPRRVSTQSPHRAPRAATLCFVTLLGIGGDLIC